MQIIDMALDKLIPYARNPRKNNHAIDRMASAILEFGFRVPILAKSNGEVIDGHLRIKAAQKLALATVPVVVCDDLSEAKIKALRLNINRMAELADWDDELLKLELGELKQMEFDLDLLGFDDLDDLLKDDEQKGGLTDDDEIPDVEKNIHGVKRGDIWQLGDHRLMCGDSTDKSDVAKLMNGDKVDLVFTDPPYELRANIVAQCLLLTCSNNFVLICTFKQAAELYNDDRLEFRFDFVINAHVPKSFMNSKQPYYVHQNGIYFSTKNQVTIFDCKNAKGIRSDNAYWCTIIDSPRNTSDKHGHAKNIKGMIDVLSGFHADIITDCFAGSGTSFIVAEKTNRKCYGMEIDEHYCSVIIERWQNFTGRKAEKLA